MVRVGKLTKLKSAIKRFPSFTKFTRTASGSPETETKHNNNNNKASSDVVLPLRAVYVGKSRRRYLVSSEVVDHPLFQKLVDKSKSAVAGSEEEEEEEGDNRDGVSVACEVVMFEHLLWMLHSADANQLAGSTHELVDFYTNC